MDASKTPRVPALARAIALLEALAASKHGLTLSQLARQLGCAKSSVQRLVATFECYGYVYHENHTRKYRVGLRLCDLANMALNGIGLREHARPYLMQLAARTGLTVHLAVLEQNSAVLIEKIESPRSIRVATWVGKQLGLHCTALGKALIAHFTDEQIDTLISRHGLLRHNENTICSARKFKESLAVIRRRGYAMDDEEEEIGVRCIGAPFLNDKQEIIGALSVVGRTSQIYPENCSTLAEWVIATARTISDHLKALDAGTNEPHSPATPRDGVISVTSPGFYVDRAS